MKIKYHGSQPVLVPDDEDEFGVFNWNREGRYPREEAIKIFKSQKQAQKFADKHNVQRDLETPAHHTRLFSDNLVVRTLSTKHHARPFKKNPAVETHYEEFHGAEPSTIEAGKLWVPGALITLGPAVDVGYGIIDQSSNKDGMYVHDFERGVKLLARLKSGERADTEWRGAFPTQLMVLGDWLGCTYKDGDEEVELHGPRGTRLCCTPNRNVLVVVHVHHGVQYVFRGGKLRVDDWIYR